MGRLKFFFKWSFVFTVLSVWTALIVQSLVFGAAFASSSSNIPIYLQTSAGIQRASSAEIIDHLFNKNFKIEKREETIPMKDCSLRATGGNTLFGTMDLGNKNDLSINVNSFENGDGGLTLKNERDRFEVSFSNFEILKTNSEILMLKGKGKGKLNADIIEFNPAMLTFNKSSNKVSITGLGVSNFETKDMEVGFIEGCLTEKKQFILITDQGELNERRSIEEVRILLREHPEFIEAYERLRRLFTDYWFLAIPTGGVIIS